jgi:hypothetical protein
MAAVNSGGTDELEALYLYDGGTLIATAYVTSSSANQNPVLFNMETNPLPVAVNTTKTLTIKGDTAIIDNLSSSSTGTANSGFTPSIASGAVTAKTNGAAATITSATLTFPSYRILKSVPTVTLSSTGSVASDPDADLIDVTIGADAKGPIGLYKLTFKVSTTTVTAAGYTVYEGNTLVATESSTAEQGINRDKYDGYDTLEVYFNLGGTIGGRLREIGAGSSKTYTLKATVTGYTTSGNVSVSLLGDDTVATYARASAVEAEDDDDFIWSDLSYSNTSTTATQTPQWLNGFEIDSSGGFVGTTSSARSI